MRFALTGATGFIGSRLIEILLEEPGTAVLLFSRSAASAREKLPEAARRGLMDPVDRVKIVEWDYAAALPPAGSLDGVDAVIHLAGEGVAAKRWSAAQKKRIRDSRVLSTRHLIEGLKSAAKKPSVVVSASAIGYYGPHGDEELDEDSPPGNDFLANVCQDWENEARRAALHGIREVRVRIGVVLGLGGGALKPLLPAFKMLAGGPLGSGRQWMSWIHRDDVVRLLIHAAGNESARGPLNGTAPHPVRNAEFAKALGKVLHRPAVVPTPGFALRIILGEFAEILTTGQRVLPRRTLESGFEFLHGDLEPALRDVLARPARSAAGMG